MLDLIEGVAKLELLATEQADRFELLSTRMDLLAQDVTQLAVGARASGDQLRRVARLIVGLAGDHQRIEGLEERVEKLERKAG